ncbi:hypothetical protein [Methylorubrum podarium]|jgi:hypothetical protein|uniref:hypothetical protein n=1 Tax=Methylorubrum podarium TaxID=200476 RepID=UPI001EE21E46|nr:hypothetical protein [Methylorubrum podarium]GJE70417.1 hypothetical protein CHKEEEPN_1955 [Methylorubrum podarium]
MADVLEELTADALTRAQVEDRVEDWAQRIAGLYGRIESWLPPGWSSRRTRRVRMIEEPMREVDLPPRELPVLDLLADEAPAATIEPRGLWIVGANGRLDLRRGADHHLILDRAANFEEPDWVLVPLSDRRRALPLDRSALSSVLR